MASSIKRKKRILVIGNTGVGKSSIIRYMNATDKDNKPPLVKRGQRGGTFHTEFYENDKFIFSDTIGFGETQQGTVPSEQVLDNLVDFLVGNMDGFNLILFVTNNDRIEKSVVKTYQIIDTIITKEIPKILVKTHDTAEVGNLIPEEDLEHWKLDYCFFCNGCRVSYPDIEELKTKQARETKIRECEYDINSSNSIITKLIDDHALTQDVRLYEPHHALSKFRHLVNAVAIHFKWPSIINALANLIDVYKIFGYDEATAKLKAACLQRKLDDNM